MIILTYHAVEQYVSRVDRSLTFEEAWEELTIQLPHADRLRKTSLRGDTLWSLPSGLLLITKPSGKGGNVVAVTVLKAPQSQSVTDEELALAIGDVRNCGPTDERAAAEFHVTVPYVLSRDNEDTVLAKIENTLRGALLSLMKNGVAGAVIEAATVTRKERSR